MKKFHVLSVGFVRGCHLGFVGSFETLEEAQSAKIHPFEQRQRLFMSHDDGELIPHMYRDVAESWVWAIESDVVAHEQ